MATTYWQTWAKADLAARKDNSVSIIQRLTVDRGKILAADGTVLANNRATRKHGLTIFTRHYPQNDLASQVTGYSTNAGTTTGIEQAYDDYLTGANTNLSNTFRQTLDKLGGQTVHGDDVYLTLRPQIQRLALDQLAGRCGAVVVLDAKTGAVVAMASSPTYNANLIQADGYDEDPQDQGHLRRRTRRCRTTRPRPLSAGLDVQDRHGVGGARLRQVHADLAASTTPATASSTARGSTTRARPIHRPRTRPSGT